MISIAFKTVLDRAKEGFDAETAALKSAIHSGNGGDILYSLPAVKALGVRHLILNVYRAPDPHRKLPEDMAAALVPLLLAQDYIDRVTIVAAGVPLERVDADCIGVDYILDRFREQDFTQMHLMHAYARAFNVEIDPNEPFLSVPAASSVPTHELILSLTPRYRALSDEFVRELALYFDDILAISIPNEWRSISGFDAPVRKCGDFLELAQLIQHSRVFIGNPSLASAIAEGLKARRIVDLPAVANAFPIGPRGYALPTRQADFFDIVHRLYPENPRINTLYSDLNAAVQQLTAENTRLRQVAESAAACLRELAPRPDVVRDALSLISEAEKGHALLAGGSETRFDLDSPAIYLHPAPPGGIEASARFIGINLAGFGLFDSEIALNNEQSPPVCFLFRLYNSDAELMIESSKEVTGATKLRWQVEFPAIYTSGTVELSTRMGDSATSNEFAWAWFRNPRLRSF